MIARSDPYRFSRYFFPFSTHPFPPEPLVVVSGATFVYAAFSSLIPQAAFDIALDVFYDANSGPKVLDYYKVLCGACVFAPTMWCVCGVGDLQPMSFFICVHGAWTRGAGERPRAWHSAGRP